MNRPCAPLSARLNNTSITDIPVTSNHFFGCGLLAEWNGIDHLHMHMHSTGPHTSKGFTKYFLEITRNKSVYVARALPFNQCTWHGPSPKSVYVARALPFKSVYVARALPFKSVYVARALP